ncbi:toprim domain-containing protein [Oceanobacillus sp. CAU 1775]
MMNYEPEKVIIVEGLTDKRKVEEVLDEDVTIICTNGSLSLHRFDELLETYLLDENDVYILVDEDKQGNKLRKQLARELPHAEHIYINSDYREVATTPHKVLASLLLAKRFTVRTLYLI